MKMARLSVFSALALAAVLFIASNCLAQSPGDTVGNAYYYWYQTNGSTGHRIALDSQGGVHFTWMVGWLFWRHVYYNYLSPDGTWGWPGQGTQVDYRNGAGYPQIAVTLDDRAGIAYHLGGTADSIYYAVDSFTGVGIFDCYRPPNRLDAVHLLWPYMTIDRQGHVHLVATEYTDRAGQPQIVGYTRSENGGSAWTSLTRFDTLTTISAMITASPVSDKVAIVYAHPTDTASQLKNDVYYIQSADGSTWDFVNGKVNVTHYGQGGDSLFAYTDVDAVYDYNDVLHITWNAAWVTDQGISERVFLYHYVVGGAVTEITHLDFPQDDSCQLSPWNLAINKMSLAADPEGAGLFSLYSRFDSSDCSADSQSNADIFLQWSTDDGSSWSVPMDLTNSHTPGCDTGQCASDVWPSLAEKINDYLHMSFICQTRGGSNPVLYLAVPVSVVSVPGSANPPAQLGLSQNYPNPFNARTSIQFDLRQDSDIRLEVYDITGARVAVLADGRMRAGTHSLVWDASEVASGVYYYRLTTDGGSQVRKMTLLK